MKFFTNKSIWTKIVIVLIFVILFEFAIPKSCFGEPDNNSSNLSIGDNDNTDNLSMGGKLLKPVLSLFVTLADSVINGLNESIMQKKTSLLYLDLASDWQDFLRKAGGLLITAGILVIGAVFAAVTGGVSLGAAVAYACGATAVGLGAHFLVFQNLSVKTYAQKDLPINLYLPEYTFTPEEIFQGKILLFNVDFFNEPKDIWVKVQNPVSDNVVFNTSELTEQEIINQINGNNVEYYFYEEDINGDGQEERIPTSSQDTARELRNVISKWYVGLRNIAIVCMMIVLLYIAIRILLSSVAADKAKYLQMLKDWAIGLVLLATMHYIMAFANVVVNKVTDIVSTSVGSKQYVLFVPDDTNNNISKYFIESGRESLLEKGTYDSDGNFTPNENGDEYILAWPTNLMGALRLQAQLEHKSTTYIASSLCFCALVVFTIYFAIVYIKRVLYMAFLTLIAPVVALTYPIDKITDGSAQGFDKWLKEYIFNLLLQPMHLLLYYVLVTSAWQLAGKNVLYSIIAIGFMMPAEKLLRSFFGFEKAHTPPALGSAATTALTLGAMKKIADIGKSTKNKISNKLRDKDEEDKDQRRLNGMGGGVDQYDDSSGEDSSEEDTDIDTANPDEDSEDENIDTVDTDTVDTDTSKKQLESEKNSNGNKIGEKGKISAENLRALAALSMPMLGSLDKNGTKRALASANATKQPPKLMSKEDIEKQLDAEEKDQILKRYKETGETPNDWKKERAEWRNKRRRELDPVLDKYLSEGGSINSYGQYFDPYQDEYNDEYDPHNDEELLKQFRQNIPNEENIEGIEGIDFDNLTDGDIDINDPEYQNYLAALAAAYAAMPKKKIKRPGKKKKTSAKTKPKTSSSTSSKTKDPIKMPVEPLTRREQAKRYRGAKNARFKAKARNTIRKVPRAVIETAGSVGGTVAGGLIGGAFGLVGGTIAAMTTGDPKNAFKGLGGGAVGGAMVGSNIGDNVGDKISTKIEQKFKLDRRENPQKAYNAKYNGGKYKEIAEKEEIEKWKKEHKRELELNFTKEEIKDMSRDNGIIEMALRSNVDDVENISAAYLMTKNGDARDEREAIQTAKHYKRMGDDYDGVNRKEWEKRVRKEVHDKLGVDKEEAKTRTKKIFNNVDKFKKYKKGLY